MFSDLSELVGLGSLNVLLAEAMKASVVLTVALTALVLMRRSSAARRHLVLSVAVAGVLLMPVASMLLPSLEVGLPVLTPRVETSGAVEPLPAVERLRETEPAVPVALGVEPAPPAQVHGEKTARPAHTRVDREEAAGLSPSPPTWARMGSNQAAPQSTSLSTSVPLILLGLWIFGALVVLGGVGVGVARLRWIEARATRIGEGRLFQRLELAADRAKVSRVPVLLRGDDRTIPMTWGVRRAVIMLPVEAEEWETWRVDAVLAHELGHVSRGDYVSQMVAQAVCALHWFNPLTWVAAHRMRVEREHACDDFVLRLGYDGYSYAQELVELARALRAPRMAGALCFARANRLRDRLAALLDESRDRRPLTHGTAVAITAVTLVALLPLAALSAVPTSPVHALDAQGTTVPPAAVEALAAPDDVQADRSTARASTPAAPPSATPLAVQEAHVLCGPADGDQEHHMHSTNDDVVSIDLRYGECRTAVKIEGEMAFNSDFSAVSRMERGSRLSIEVRRSNDRRRVEIEPGSNGRPEYNWSVDGREAPFDGEAARWVEAAFLDMFRMTSFQADERAAWIISQEGPDGLLAEVEQMWSDHVQARYLSFLLADRNLTPAQVGRTMEFASANIESDHSLGQVLMSAAEHQAFGPQTRSDFIAAASTLESDHTHGQVLALALSRDDLSLENLEALLESATLGIESDHQMAQILKGLADRYTLDPTLRPAFLRAASTLDSDHQKGEVYSVVLAQAGLDPSELAMVLDAATEIESGHTLAQLLIQATAQDLGNAQLRSAFLEASNSIESDHNRAAVLTAALQLEGLSDADLASILSSASSISSDHNLAELLLEVAGRRPAGPALRAAYLEAARTIESDHSLGNALGGFVELDLDDDEVVATLDVARLIESDHSLAALLIQVVERNQIDGAVREAFMRALDTIESEHTHGQVSSALVGR